MSDKSEKHLNHLAIIMDGNGRWAKAIGKPRTFGHREGAKAFERAVESFQKLGGKYLTVFAFSTENWNRPEFEVSEIMRIVSIYLRARKKYLMDNNICLRILGDKESLSVRLKKALTDLENASQHNDKLFINIAFNYGGRLDIVNAVKSIANKVKNSEIKIDDINPDLISDNLWTAGLPEPDMIVRTSGEHRVSNFLMWQMAYSEMYFVDYHWPEFNEEKMKDIFEEYSKRNRRYGAIKDEDA